MTTRQILIIDIVKENEPITSEQIADRLNVTRSAIRSDLSVLTMAGILDARPRVGYFCTGNTPSSMLKKRVNELKVEEIKAQPVVIREDTTVYDAIITLFLRDVGSLFVVQDDENLVGVVSRKDLLKIAIGNADADKIPVSRAMTRMPNVVTVTPDESALDAAIKIVDRSIDALPVVSMEKIGDKAIYKVIGKVTKTTITKLFVEFGRS